MWLKQQKKQINDDYVLLRQIGSGSYGIVWAAQNVHTKEKAAIKEIHNLWDHQILKLTLREIRLLRHFDHPNIIPIVEIFATQPKEKFDTIFVVSPLMDTDLHKLINSNTTLSKEHHQLFIYQLLRGLKCLHSANVLHRDLKPKNILVNKTLELRICDLGMGRGESGPSLRMTLLEQVATPYYRAPEGILFKNDSYDKSVDVWASGCILAELLLRKPIFPGNSSPELIKLIIDLLGTPTDEELDKIPKSKYKEFIASLPQQPKRDFKQIFLSAEPLAIDLLQKILVFDPEKRITVEQALQHPYLEEWHDSADEPVAESTFIPSETAGAKADKVITLEEFRELIWKEVEYYQKKKQQRAEEKQPCATDQPKPTTDQPKPTTDQPKPTTDQPKPTTDQPKPTTDQPKPTTDQPKPTTDQPNQTIDQPKQPTIDQPKQPTIDQPSTTDEPTQNLSSQNLQLSDKVQDSSVLYSSKPISGDQTRQLQTSDGQPSSSSVISQTAQQ